MALPFPPQPTAKVLIGRSNIRESAVWNIVGLL
jgi:hypothetical protein